MSTHNLVASLRHLQQRRKRLLEECLRNKELVVGTVSELRARCGKPGCRCASGPGHPQMRLLYAEAGRRRCKLIRKADEERIRAAGQRYRQLRSDLRELAALNSREIRLLRELIRRRGLRYE